MRAQNSRGSESDSFQRKFMLKKTCYITFILLSGCFLCSCSNKYYKTYRGNHYPSTKHCALIDAELNFISHGMTPENQISSLKHQGYQIIGTGKKNSKASASEKHRQKIYKTCKAVGADIAFFDSQEILYFKNFQLQKR